MCSFLSLPFKPYALSRFPLPKPYSLPLPKSHICFASNPSNSDPEEVRWLREEQRWLREEQRWLREESRWTREREFLLSQISELKLRIQALESQGLAQGGASSAADTIASIAGLVQALKEKSRISESGSGPVPMVLEEKREEDLVVEEVKEVVRVLEGGEKGKKRKALRKGAEGVEVRSMQDALQKLGFYSGEEDMEYSSFSSGTERAVKTWQATLGATEDGIMTAELLEKLYMAQYSKSDNSNKNANQKGSSVILPQKGDTNGAAVTNVTEISGIQQTVVKDDVTEVDVSQHRVFLLGENRWEEPSRLIGNKPAGIKTKNAMTRCVTCRGEGRLMCTECDGTGEPNIEPQFLEWVDEGTKCPYCEGHGFTVCDVCEGKSTV